MFKSFKLYSAAALSKFLYKLKKQPSLLVYYLFPLKKIHPSLFDCSSTGSNLGMCHDTKTKPLFTTTGH